MSWRLRVLDQNMRRRIFFMLEDSTSLEGQWTGIARTDDAEGLAIIDVDGEHLQFRGTARLFNNEEPGAFFAYRRKQSHGAPSDKIRIFIFDRASWMRDYAQLQVINFAQPHFSVLEALAIENARALPQQSLSTLTNVDDIESYIRISEQQTGKKYLKAIDLPASQRREVMVELSLMGITAGSLFPGLDGACEELYGRMFHP
jgi:hypothetical protein